MVCLAVVLLSAVVTSIYVYQKNQRGFTELYLLGEDGKAADYPQNLSVGEEGQFSLTVVNQERQTETYLIQTEAGDCRVRIDGKEATELSLTLEYKEQRTYDVTFVFTSPGEGRKLEFDLFKTDQPEVYLQTYLKVDVE
jgi:uncharacterized membrane protein